MSQFIDWVNHLKHSRIIPAMLSLVLLASAALLLQYGPNQYTRTTLEPSVLGSDDICQTASASAVLSCRNQLELTAE